MWWSETAQIFIVLAAVTTMARPSLALDTSQLRRISELTESTLRTEGANVSTEDQAQKIAVQAYFKKMGGLRALETAKVVSNHRLGVQIRGLARKGDRVWEVRIYGVRDLSAVIWVHSQSAKTFFLIPRE